MNSVFKSLLVLSLALVGLCTAIRIPADPVNPDKDAVTLRNAIIQSDERLITNLLTRRSQNQRLAIVVSYKKIFGSDLDKDLADELSGDYEELIVALVTPLPVYYAKQFKEHEAVRDILFTSSNAVLKELGKAVRSLKITTIIHPIFGLLTQRMVDGAFLLRRNASQVVDENAALVDAKVLREIGEMMYDRSDDDVILFEDIFIQRSYKQLRQIFKEYKRFFGHDIEEAFVKQGFSNRLEATLIKFCSIVRSPPIHFAKRLYYALRQPDFGPRVTTRIIVSRSEIDLEDIKAAFQTQFKKSLRSDIETTTSGEYMRALRQIVGP